MNDFITDDLITCPWASFNLYTTVKSGLTAVLYNGTCRVMGRK
jgi:hypothetical protein